MKEKIKRFFEKAKSSLEIVKGKNLDEKEIFNSIIDSILIIDKEHNILDVNSAFLNLVGKKKEDIVGKKCYEIVHGTDKPIEGCNSCKVFETKQTGSFEIYHPGLKKHLWISASPILEKGEVSKIVHHIRDITKMKKAEEDLSQQRKEQQIILDSVPAMIFYKDKKDRFIQVNETLAKAFHMSKEQIIGKTAHELSLGKDYWEDDKKVMASGQPIRNIIEPIETPEGTRWVQTDKIPYRDVNGNIIGIIGFAIDITVQKNAEEALKESEGKYKTLIENASDFIFMIDKNDKVLSLNKSAAMLFRRKPEEVRGTSIFKLFPKETATHFSKDLKKIFQTGERVSSESKMVVENKEFKISTCISPIRNHKGEIIAVMGISRDITEKKKAELEKEKLQKRLAKYAKKLEIKLKKLNGDKINLTDKEKLVLWGITRYVYDSDKKLSERLKIKRSTVTAIRNRLRDKDLYDVINIPNFKALGAELMIITYGRFGANFEKRIPDMEEKALEMNPIYGMTTNSGFVGLIISKSIAEFEKNMTPFRDILNSQDMIKKVSINQFLFELNKVPRILSYSKLLKNSFNIKIKEESVKKKQETKIKLNKNEKKVLLAMIEYPDLSAYDLSFKVDLTRTTVAKIKKKLIQHRLVKTRIIPNLLKLGFELMMLTHLKHGPMFEIEMFNSMLKKNPYIVFLVGGNRETIAISFFKDYNEYKEVKERMPHDREGLFLEEPIMLKSRLKDIKFNKFNFLDAAKKLLE